MTARFKALEKREQYALIIGLAFVFIFILYQFVLTPFNEKIARMEKDLRYQKTLIDFMQGAIKRYQHITPQAHLTTDALLSETARTIKQSKLKGFTYDLQQADGDKVRLVFKQVPYVLFLKWMESFWQQFSLSLSDASIKPEKTPGIVKISITFSTK